MVWKIKQLQYKILFVQQIETKSDYIRMQDKMGGTEYFEKYN